MFFRRRAGSGSARRLARAMSIGLAMITGACATQMSHVDLAPYDLRPHNAPMETGRYCTARQVSGDWVVDATECGVIEWDKKTRELTVADEGQEDDADRAAVSSLGHGLFLVQTTEQSDGQPVLFSINMGLAFRRSALVLPVLPYEPRRDLVARHTKVAFEDADGKPVIRAGERKDILAFLRDSAALVAKASQETPDDISIVVREDRHGDNLGPTQAQKKGIRDILKARDRLAAQAPAGIDAREARPDVAEADEEAADN